MTATEIEVDGGHGWRAYFGEVCTNTQPVGEFAMTYGIFHAAPPLVWPVKEPSAVLDYALVVDGSTPTAERYAAVTDTAEICAETILSASLAFSPADEMIVENIAISGGIITAWLSGGVPGRPYEASVIATSATRTYQWIVGIVCDPFLADWPLSDPAVPGFGAAVTWTASGGPPVGIYGTSTYGGSVYG